MAARMQLERRRNDCFYSIFVCKSNQCKKKKIFTPPTSSTVTLLLVTLWEPETPKHSGSAHKQGAGRTFINDHLLPHCSRLHVYIHGPDGKWFSYKQS
ncbi:unnamed protein product [Staurois parvus]|uniref:Uncharacterized protein n=1 Tax=Staurois parvus TaxID=386267 RepID=A0ABN9GIP1_9NEOB|nr:unnamed protein product [Staurois parvus]